MIPVDFRTSSERALELGFELAKKFDSSLTPVHTWDLPVRTSLDKALSTLHLAVPKAPALLRHGASWREILAVIEHDPPDLLSVGTHRRHPSQGTHSASVATMDTKNINAKIDNAAEKAKELLAKANAKVSEVADKASRTAAEAGDKVEGLATKGEHRLQETAEKVGHDVKEITSKVVHATQETVQKVLHGAKEAATTANHHREEPSGKAGDEKKK